MKFQRWPLAVALLLAAVSVAARIEDPAAFNRAWDDLGSADEAQVAKAQKTFRDGGPSASAYLLEKLLTNADRAKVADLLVQLDDPDFKTRERAKESLIALGKSIDPMLEDALRKNPGDELTARVLSIRKSLGQVYAPPPAEFARQELAVALIAEAGPAAFDSLKKIESGSVWQSTRLKAAAALSDLNVREAKRLFDLADAAARRGEPAKDELKAAFDFVAEKSLFGDDAMSYRRQRCQAIVLGMQRSAELAKVLAADPKDAKSRAELLQIQLSLGDSPACLPLVESQSPRRHRRGSHTCLR